MHNSTRVISAWDGDKLVGLVRALDDGETVAFLHYLLVDPAYQGQYIGDELMKRIMSFYQKQRGPAAERRSAGGVSESGKAAIHRFP